MDCSVRLTLTEQQQQHIAAAPVKSFSPDCGIYWWGRVFVSRSQPTSLQKLLVSTLSFEDGKHRRQDCHVATGQSCHSSASGSSPCKCHCEEHSHTLVYHMVQLHRNSPQCLCKYLQFGEHLLLSVLTQILSYLFYGIPTLSLGKIICLKNK